MVNFQRNTVQNNQLESYLKDFSRVSLDEIKNVELMNRIDSKCWFAVELLPAILTEIAPYYDLLAIENESVQVYKNTYYDTVDDTFYLDHQNSRAKRVKVRKREYVGSKLQFLEVKHKTNKGLTKKRRIDTASSTSDFPENERDFLNRFIEESPESLDAVLQNRFNRITLIHKNLQERCTIDFNLTFIHEDSKTSLKQLVIIELKHGVRGVKSELSRALKSHRIPFNGFSKYCLGRALMEPNLKQNRLKHTLLEIRKIQS